MKNWGRMIARLTRETDCWYAWRREMSEESIDTDLLFAGGSHALLERIICTEYLLTKGYLPSDLEELPPQVVKNLVAEACRFATRRLSELGFIERYQFGMPFSLN
jgi:hypothetical protein